MANPGVSTFGQPTTPVTINIPTAQLPQPTVPTQPQQQQAVAPAPVQQQPQQQQSPSVPAARYYSFPWKSKRSK